MPFGTVEKWVVWLTALLALHRIRCCAIPPDVTVTETLEAVTLSNDGGSLIWLHLSEDLAVLQSVVRFGVAGGTFL